MIDGGQDDRSQHIVFRREYLSDVRRVLGQTEITNIDLFESCAERRKQFGLPEGKFGINKAVSVPMLHVLLENLNVHYTLLL